MIRVSSLRFRMMLLFCITVGVFLAGTYFVIYVIFERDLRQQFDRRLLDTADPIVADLIANPTEQDVFTLDLPNQYLELIEPSGHVLQYSRSLQHHALGIPAPRGITETTFITLDDAQFGQLRIATIPFVLGRSNLYLAVGVSTRDLEQTLASFRKLLWTLLPLSLIATALISAWFSGRSLRPVVDLTRHATELTHQLDEAGDRELVLPMPLSNSGDELGQLATAFNKLFGRLTAALKQLRQFVSDASHEIRTPLAVLRGETELLLSQRREPEQYESALRVIDDELKKLVHIVEALFTLSIADAGQLRVSRDRLYLDGVLEEACELALSLARAKSITIAKEIAEEVAYEGDEVLLRQLFLIFLDNAIKYSPPHTCVRVQLESENGTIRVRFRDQGIGIASEHLPHIFERFYRAVDAEVGEARSGGLGLAIAQAIVKAQHGSIDCATAPGAGSTFTVTLPAKQWGEINRN